VRLHQALEKIGRIGVDYRTDGCQVGRSRLNRRVFVVNPRIVSLEARDVRFPTSLLGHGSDAMHPDPDYSAAYVVLRTDVPGLEGHGLTFTIGSGTEICVVAARAFEPMVVGKTMDGIRADMRGFWRTLAADTRLRWLGPEKGVVHLAAAAVVNAVWDLWAKLEEKPLWKLLVDLTPEELVACVDFSYISDELDETEALELLETKRRGREVREAELRASGYPAYTTSAGWLGYDDATIQALAEQAVADGFAHLKMKVGRDLDQDLRRARLLRETVGPDCRLMMDANQSWSVPEAVAAVARLREFDPWWIEEPTSPDDILGHARIRAEIAPVRVATGEHVQNRIVFKQLFQAQAIDVCQIDACRLGGVNEVIAVLLLAAKFDVAVCPHAGGVGLCEYVQHLAAFDYIAVSGTLDDRVVEWVDHLHEHFKDPAVVRGGRYVLPRQPGYSVEMLPESVDAYEYPTGPAWVDAALALEEA
jgi:L-fuconate dehydratase